MNEICKTLISNLDELSKTLKKSSQRKNRYKFCICFFGLIRYGKKSIPSIKKNIYDILEKNNIDYDVYLHTYDVSIVNVPLNGEHNIKIDNTEWKNLEPDFSSVTSQDEFDKTYDFNSIKKFGLTRETKYNDTLYNMFRQLNSLKIVTEMWEIRNIDYDLYLYIRPDLVYTTELPINDILKNNDFVNQQDVIFLPSWGNDLKREWLNDRISFGSKTFMLQYGKRINDALSYCNGELSGKCSVYHPEKFVYFLYKKYNWNLSTLPFKGKRIRANGKFEPKDSRL